MTTAVMLGGPCHGLLVLTNGLQQMIVDVPAEPQVTQPNGYRPRPVVRVPYSLRRVTFDGYHYSVYLSPGLLGTILTREHLALIVDKRPTKVKAYET